MEVVLRPRFSESRTSFSLCGTSFQPRKLSHLGHLHSCVHSEPLLFWQLCIFFFSGPRNKYVQESSKNSSDAFSWSESQWSPDWVQNNLDLGFCFCRLKKKNVPSKAHQWNSFVILIVFLSSALSQRRLAKGRRKSITQAPRSEVPRSL